MLEDVTAAGAYVLIVSDSLEIVLFGIYTIFFTFALMLLTLYRKPLPVDWTMVAALCTLFCICMTHCSLVTTDRYSTLGSRDGLPTGAEMSGLLRGADALLRFASFLSQLVMIHRCWAVWDRAWSVVCVPAIMSCASFVCAMHGPVRLPITEFRSPFVAPRDLPFDMAFCALSLTVYTTTTTLILYRLRRISAPARDVQSMEDLIFSLGKSVIEAGALLVVAQFAMLIFLLLEHPVLLIIESVATQLYGIAPTLMIIRLGISLLPEGRARWSSSFGPEFSSILFGTTCDSSHNDIELADSARASPARNSLSSTRNRHRPSPRPQP
ncbi:hypothetical protein C8Q77DRAFT_1172300 [Trametes polyzona]|nr:hypothetical protein C8Q77DRAFT_1172300 [Trametes polyzona]